MHRPSSASAIIALLFCISALTASPCRSGPSSCTALAEELQRRGYENIAVSVADSCVSVWCENRSLRFTSVWIMEAAVLAADIPDARRVRIIAQKFAQPVVALEADQSDIRSWTAGDMPTDAFSRRITVEYDGTAHPSSPVTNRSVRRVDLVLGPGRFLSEFGLEHDYVRVHIDMNVTARSTIVPGVEASGGGFLPLHRIGHNPVGGDYRNEEIRPGSVSLSYLRPWGAASFSTLTVGMFEQGSRYYDNYGAVLDVRRYTRDGKWSFGVSLASIGFFAYVVDDEPDGRIRQWVLERGGPKHFRYLALLSYRFAPYDVELTARWGRFIGGDRGWRFDMTRRFGEILISVYAIKSNGDFDVVYWTTDDHTRLLGGVALSIPLPPRRRAIPARFRVVPAEAFSWSYRYRTGQVGAQINTDHRVEDLLFDYSPQTIRSNLGRAQAWLSDMPVNE